MPMIAVAEAMYGTGFLPKPKPKGALLIWQDLPVFPMKADGVACVARSTYKGKIVWMNQ